MDPVLVAKAVILAAKQVKSEERRQTLLIILLSVLVLIGFLFSVVTYIVTHPIDAFFYDGSSNIEVTDNIKITTTSNVELKIWNYMKEIGFSDAGAAAALGNMKAESGFNPSASNGSHFGICQWGGGRWKGNKISLLDYSTRCGLMWNDLDVQLNFFRAECIFSSDKGIETSFYKVYKEMQNATDVIYATDYFCCKYEICPGTLGNWAYSVVDNKPYQGLADRRAYALAYYKKFGQ